MVATCGVGAMLYVLPMLLGRTYDVQHDVVGIDIYEQKYIDEAQKNPIENPNVDSYYLTIENTNEKRDFLGVSGELGVKIGAGLLDIKGAGAYLKDTSNLENSVEILIKMTFITATQEMNLDARPKTSWNLLDPADLGTHVVTSLTFGGEVYASVNFIAHKSEDFESIKAEIMASVSKSGAFDANAQGKLDKVAQNISSRAKMEIDYYGTVPLDGVPTTLEGLRTLVQKFQDQVRGVNNGLGVAVCAGLRKLSDFDSKFQFLKNELLVNALNDFDYLFTNLREAKTLLIHLVNSLPETVDQPYLDKIIDFSGRLTTVLRAFHEVIGNLDLQKGIDQLTPAETAFKENSHVTATGSRYTKEIKLLASQLAQKEDPNKPRGTYIRWGKRTCGTKVSDNLYIGFMTSFIEQGIGAATNYLCLPENPDLKLDPEFTGLNQRGSKISAVRYRSMSVFEEQGRHIEDKVASCTVCETPMRPNVEMYSAMLSCPGDWVQEYSGYLVSSNRTKNRAEFVCVDFDPDIYEAQQQASNEPVILPVKMGEDPSKKGQQAAAIDASIHCVVCSK